MRTFVLPAALLAAACSPPASDNVANTMSPAEYRANPPPDDPEPPRPLPLPEAAPLPPAPAGKTVEPPYSARGQEPGWALSIIDGRIDYQGNYGDVHIQVDAPAPKPIAKGRRYVTPRLTVEIVHARCNDAMSGQGYEDKVKVVAGGAAYEGCGGERRTDWDM